MTPDVKTMPRFRRLATGLRFNSVSSMLTLPAAMTRSHAQGLAYAH